MCNKISYNNIIKEKNNIDRLYLNYDNSVVFIKLRNGTKIYNYRNTKNKDILGILPFISLITK